MLKKEVEVEGGEIAIKNSHGDIAIIPKRLKSEIESLLKTKDYNAIDKLVSGLPKESDYAEDGSLLKNWGTMKTKSEPIETEDNSNQDTKDWIVGNIDEHIASPINNFLSESTGGYLGTPNSKSVRTNKYDNTEGKMENYRDADNETINKQKNLSIPQMYKQKYNTSSNLRSRWNNSIYPQGYGTTPQSAAKFATSFVSPKATGDESLRVKPTTINQKNRSDATSLYSGMPQKYDTFTKSEYSDNFETPTVDYKDPFAKRNFLKHAANHTDLFKLLAGKKVDDNGKPIEFNEDLVKMEDASDRQGGDKAYKASFRDPNNVMWNATFGLGKDDKTGGNYLSYYDKWDLAPDVASQAGNPYNVYGRIPLSDKIINAYSKFKIFPESNMVSEPDDTVKSLTAATKQAYEMVINTETKEMARKELEKLKSQDEAVYNNILGIDAKQASHLIETYGSEEFDRIAETLKEEIINGLQERSSY